MAAFDRPTLRDVAELAGVSVKTASNVIGGYARVTPATSAKVKDAVERLGYKANLGARLLRGGRTGLVGLALPNLRIPYFADVAHFVIESSRPHKWTILIDQTDGNLAQELEVLRGIRPHLIDGLIYSPLELSSEDFVKLDEDVHIVLIGEVSHQKRFDYVSIDNIEASKVATIYLIESLGRKRVGVIGREMQLSRTTGKLRLQGYQEAHNALKMKVDQSLVARVSDFTMPEGYLATKKLIEKKVIFDGLFCFNDLLAIGAMKALSEAGLRVPQDVAVIGFDDTEEGVYHTPSITSVSPDKEMLAKVAVQLLHDRIDGTYTGPARNVVVDYRIVHRESAP